MKRNVDLITSILSIIKESPPEWLRISDLMLSLINQSKVASDLEKEGYRTDFKYVYGNYFKVKEKDTYDDISYESAKKRLIDTQNEHFPLFEAHLTLCEDAGFIQYAPKGEHYRTDLVRLTWAGYEYLDKLSAQD